jgi:O-glycosyl hydrolase
MQIKSSELLEAGMNHEGLQLNDEMLDTDLPKLSFAKHRWNHEMIVLTPWLTTEPPILTQFRNTLRARNSPKQRGAYSSNSKAKILPRQV